MSLRATADAAFPGTHEALDYKWAPAMVRYLSVKTRAGHSVACGSSASTAIRCRQRLNWGFARVSGIGCMHQPHNDIYASAPLRRLRDAQARALMPELQRCFGTHALMLGVAHNDTPPALPMLGNWVRLYLDGDRYAGDLHAAADQPLPFLDDAFDLVLLRHALEISPTASALLVDAIWVLAPGGLLALAGVHPLSGWSPWLRWQARGRSLRLPLPLRLERELLHAGLGIELAQRVGRGWPGLPASGTGSDSALGGGYVLLARKHRRLATPLRIKPVSVPVPAGGRLSPGTRRSSALRTTGNT